MRGWHRRADAAPLAWHLVLLELRYPSPSLSWKESTMPLRDHFHLPLRGLCTWDSIPSGWANQIMRQLNKTLPLGYMERPNVTLGVDVQVDVDTLE